MRLKKGDKVVVIAGSEKGKEGTITKVLPREEKVIIGGVNMVKKHVKPRRQGETGGIVDAESAIYACKVAHYCSKCGKAVRVKNNILEDGKKVRVCAKCGHEL